MRREDIVVRSGGQDCAGWLYHADTAGPAATVVMAHGLAAVKVRRGTAVSVSGSTALVLALLAQAT